MIISVSGKLNSGKDTVGEIIQILTSSPHFTNEGVLSFLGRKHFTPAWEIKKWADKLKDIVCLLIGCTREQLEDREFKEKELEEEWWYYGFGDIGLTSTIVIPYLEAANKGDEEVEKYLVKLTPRLLLQLLGTECGRKIIHPNIWVNALMSEYKRPSHWENRYYDEVNKKGLAGREEVWGDLPNWIITDMRFPNELKAVEDKGGISIRVNRETQADRFAKIDTDKFHEYPRQEHESETALDNAKFNYTINNDGTLLELIQKVREILIKEEIL